MQVANSDLTELEIERIAHEIAAINQPNTAGPDGLSPMLLAISLSKRQQVNTPVLHTLSYRALSPCSFWMLSVCAAHFAFCLRSLLFVCAQCFLLVCDRVEHTARVYDESKAQQESMKYSQRAQSSSSASRRRPSRSRLTLRLAAAVHLQ